MQRDNISYQLSTRAVQQTAWHLKSWEKYRNHSTWHFFLGLHSDFLLFFFLDFNEAWCCWLTNLHVLQSLQASPMGAQPTSQRHQNTSAPITETPSGSMSTMHYFEKGKIGPAELVPTVCWRLIWFHKKLKITVGNWMISAHILLWHHQAGTGSALFVEDQT